MQRRSAGLAAAIAVLLLSLSAVPAAAQQVDSPLFEGTTADLWLVNPETGRISGYNVGFWSTINLLDARSALNVSGGEALLINLLPSSSVPMTPGQPAVSLIGVGEAAVNLVEGRDGREELLLAPDGGSFAGTTAVDVGVSRELLSQGTHELNWQAVDTDTLATVVSGGATLEPQTGDIGDSGFATETFHLIEAGTFDVTVELRRSGTLVASRGARFTIAAADRRRDTDGDGIPDLVEIDMGLDPLEDDWELDADGDGWSEFDEWLRRYCLDPVTGAPVDGDTSCLDAEGLPLDSDADNWSDFDEILRGTNHLDPEPQLDGVLGDPPSDGGGDSGGDTGGSTEILPPSIQSANFCTDGTTFYFDLYFYAAADDAVEQDIILGVGADGSPYRAPVETIRVNYGEQGQITRVSPSVRTFSDSTGDPPADRWQDGPIADFTIDKIAGFDWHVYGSVPVGSEPFAPGDQVSTFALRTFLTEPLIGASETNIVVSANPADCVSEPLPPPPQVGGELSESAERQRLRFKDFPAAQRLYEIERVVAGGTGSLATRPPAALTAGLESTGAGTGSYAGTVVQTFTAAESNLAGIDVLVAAGDEEPVFDDITLNVWQGARRNGELLISQTLRDVRIDPSAPTPVSFRFEAVPLQAGQTVYLEFRKDTAGLATTGTDTLAGGGVTVIDGADAPGDTDLVVTVFHDTAYADGTGGERPGSRWWNVAAADLNGRVAYDGATLLRETEIIDAGLSAGDIATRRRMSTLETALLADELPAMRLPAGESLVLAAVHRHRAAPIADWEPPADYSRIYKSWLPRVSDVTPVDMLADQGTGSWQTPDEWRTAFVAYLESRLVIPASPALDERSTLAVAVMESALSEEARLSGDESLQLLTAVFQPGQPVYLWEPLASVFASPAADPSPYVEEWELALTRLATGDFTLDDSLDAVTTALSPGNPLAAVADWLRARFYEGVPGTASDEYMARRLRRSFDGSCFVRADVVAALQANDEGWSEFLDRCPVWFDETGIATRLDEDRERRYEVRLNLLPEAPAEVAADVTLLTRETDSDSDGYFNVSEVSVPVEEITLPWLADSDGDSIADGDDRCPNDPLNECGPNPVLPTITVEADIVVFEPSAATGTALVAVQMNRLYDEPVTVCYEALADTADTATAGADFQAVTGCVTIEPGQLSALIEVPVFADGVTEGAESFTVNITSVENGTLADDGTVLVTLNDTEGGTALPPDVQLANNAIVTDERQSVTLDASASTDPNGQALSYTWTQLTTAAPAVSLQGVNTAVASFTAPVTLDPVDLEFEVLVTNDAGLSAVDQVSVTVNPVNDPPFVTAEPSEQVVAGDTLEFPDETLLAFVEDPDNDPLATGAILSQPAIGRVEDTGTGFLYSSSTEPALEVDQSNDGGVSGGIGTPVVQTFIPRQPNLAGVDAYLNGTSSLTADVTLNVWPAGAVGVGEPLATATIPDHPRLTDIPFRFSPIPVVPGQSYALEFRFSRLLIGTRSGGYADGDVVGRPGTDVYFRTYYDPTYPLPVPLPDQLSPGIVSGGYGSPVVQTFVPRQSNLIGIDASLIGTAALSSDVTVKVWREEALRVGEPLVSSTLADVPRDTLMQFRFPAVEVTPGTSYAMEFLIADSLNMGAVIPGQYPDGAVIEGGGNLFEGGADLQFTTYYDATYSPTDLLASIVSEPQIVSWELLGDGQQILLHETGTASDFPGSDRVIAFDLATRARELLLEGAPSEFRTGERASAGWFTLPGELHRYDALAAEPFASAAAPESLPVALAATAVDPRNGDLVYCGGADPVLGLPGWIRIDSDTLATTGPIGNCPGSAELLGAPVAERFCVVFDQSNLVCTGSGGVDWAAEVPATAFGSGDHRMVGLVPAGDSALLFVIREESSIPQAIGVYLIDESGFDPAALDPQSALEPLALLERELPVGVMPEVEVMPDGRVVIILAPSSVAGLNGQRLEMWTWSGDTADLTMTQVDTNGPPTLEDRMGALATVDGVLYWQVQAFDSTPVRLIYVVDPLPGSSSPTALYATVSGDPEGAPYDFLVAGPETFGVFVETGTAGVCDVLELPNLELGAENASCQRYASVPGFGALYELDDSEDIDLAPDNLIFLGAGEATSGPTSFSIEITDGEFTIELPVNIEVIEP